VRKAMKLNHYAPICLNSMLSPDEQFDLDAIFGEDMGDEADDLFDMDNLAEIAREDSSSPTKGALGYDQARELGLLD
jgi:hypothetical protein